MVDGSYAKASGGNNRAGYSSPEVNSLLTKADSYYCGTYSYPWVFDIRASH
jgi:hypothetical protein